MPNSSKKHEYESFSGCGMDVGVNRADDLDKKLLEEIKENPGCTVLDLGCGAGGQAMRMSEAGAKVIAVDIDDFADNFSGTKIEFIQGDIVNLSALVEGREFDFVICQRTLHYLKYEDAKDLLKYLKSITRNNLYISVTGLDSEIGNNYPYKNKDISERFGRLEDFAQELFGITESVCLYSQDEFENLLQETGFEVEKVWQSAFGNIKAIVK